MAEKFVPKSKQFDDYLAKNGLKELKCQKKKSNTVQWFIAAP